MSALRARLSLAVCEAGGAWLDPALGEDAPPIPSVEPRAARAALVVAEQVSARGEIPAPPVPLAGARILAVVRLGARGRITVEPPPGPVVRASEVLTDLGVLEVRPEGLVIVELAKGVSARDLQEHAAAPLKISPRVQQMRSSGDPVDGVPLRA